MKRILIAAIAALMLFALSSCGASAAITATQTPQVTADPLLEGGDRTILFEDYPIDTMPLYACVAVEECKLSQNVQSAQNPYAYYVTYHAQASKKDILSYYGSLMTDVTNELGDDSVVGTIGGCRAFAYTRQNEGEDGLEVHLLVTVAQGPEEHPYFSGYPAIVPEPESGKSTLISRNYWRLDRQGHYMYTLTYGTDMTSEEVASYYEPLLRGKDDYCKSDSEYSLTYMYRQDGHLCAVSYSKEQQSGTAFMTISCDNQDT